MLSYLCTLTYNVNWVSMLVSCWNEHWFKWKNMSWRWNYFIVFLFFCTHLCDPDFCCSYCRNCIILFIHWLSISIADTSDFLVYCSDTNIGTLTLDANPNTTELSRFSYSTRTSTHSLQDIDYDSEDERVYFVRQQTDTTVRSWVHSRLPIILCLYFRSLACPKCCFYLLMILISMFIGISRNAALERQPCTSLESTYFPRRSCLTCLWLDCEKSVLGKQASCFHWGHSIVWWICCWKCHSEEFWPTN